jgi:hypothetical protein
MLRIVISYVVPFLLPLAGYAAWIWYRTRYAERHGGEAPKFEQGPWPLMLFLGAVLTLTMLAVTALQQGAAPGGVYVPPHVENGQVVPGRFESKPAGPP